MRSRYVEHMMASLAQLHAKILVSETPGQHRVILSSILVT